MLYEIRFENGQLLMSFFPEFVFIVLVPIFFVSEIFTLKIGLKLAKAQERRGFRWVMLSVLIQVGFLLFIAAPFIFLAFMGFFSGDPNSEQGSIAGALAPILIAFAFFALSLDIHLINILHKIGFKRSFGVFLLMMIPIALIIGISVAQINAASQAYWQSQNGGGFGSLILVIQTILNC